MVHINTPLKTHYLYLICRECMELVKQLAAQAVKHH